MPASTAQKGDKFNRLTLVKKLEKTGANGSRWWKCKCDCGNEYSGRFSAISCGNVKSCGCLKKEVTSKTGKENTADS